MAVSPLAALIHECQKLFRDTHGVELSYNAISRRSGGAVARNRVHQLATDPIRAMPTPVTIRGLAVGLGVPETVVMQRALASAGYLVPADWHTVDQMLQVNYGGQRAETESGHVYEAQAAKRRVSARLRGKSAEDVLAVIDSETVEAERDEALTPEQQHQFAADMEAVHASPTGDPRDVVFEDAGDPMPDASVEESAEDRDRL